MNAMIFLLLCLCAIKATGQSYTKLPENSECPVSAVIREPDQCRKYAKLNETWTYKGEVTWGKFPKGCFQMTNGTVYLNEARPGSAALESHPICVDISETRALVYALKWYGVMFAICFLLYIVIRPRFPLLYNFRNSVAEFDTRTTLAEENHGIFRWIWCIFKYSDDEIFDHCGMDGVVLIRILRLGLKLSLVGVFNSTYLIPVYFIHATLHNEFYEENDPLSNISLSAIEGNSDALIATAISAYVLFSSAMYFLFREFEWFTTARHKFLRMPRPDNYTVYVTNIPKEYRSDIALQKYFQSIFGARDVIDSRIARDIPVLENKVAAREKAITKLERTTYLQEDDLIRNCRIKLEELNSEISSMISQIESRRIKETEEFNSDAHFLSKIICYSEDLNTPLLERPPLERPLLERPLLERQGALNHAMGSSAVSPEEGLLTDMVGLTVDSAKAAINAGKKTLKVPQHIVSFIAGSGDEGGEPRDAGFVSFSRLWCKAQAIQILHDRVPFTFKVTNAPLPKYIFWHNVGISRKKKLVGAVIANSLWMVLSVLFLLLTASVTALTQIDNLGIVDNATPEFLKKILALLRPLALVLLSVLVPPILKNLGKYEGHISLTALEASLYSKYAVFLIIQIFFTQTIVSSLASQYKEIINDVKLLLTFLGTAVPKQVGNLMQYVLVRTFLTCLLELLRVPAVIVSSLRRILGPNLTENEQNSTWLGMSPLSVARRLNYPISMSYLMINFMCLFVFSCIAPIMSVILVFVFGLLNLTYRNQLIYIYSRESDTGGQLWVRFMKLIISCMMVSECALIAIMLSKTNVLSKEKFSGKAVIYATSLIPLLIMTVYFSEYLKKEHYRATEYLPSISCQEEDTNDSNLDRDLSFVKGKYIQPALEENVPVISDYGGLRNDSEISDIDSRKSFDLALEI